MCTRKECVRSLPSALEDYKQTYKRDLQPKQCSVAEILLRLRAEFPSRPRAGPTDLTGLLAMSSQVVVISFVDRRSWHRCTSNPSSKASSPPHSSDPKSSIARNCKFFFFFRLTDGWSGQRDDGWWWFLLKKNFQVFVVFVGAPVTAKRRSNQPTVRRF
jgi:hypothetical protein